MHLGLATFTRVSPYVGKRFGVLPFSHCTEELVITKASRVKIVFQAKFCHLQKNSGLGMPNFELVRTRSNMPGSQRCTETQAV